MKKILSLVLVVLMIAALAACGKKETSTSTEAATEKATEKATEAATEAKKMYYDNDVSEHVDLVLYYVGGTYGDEELIFARVNEIMEEKINATIEFKRMDSSEHETKYSLLLAGDEQVDLIYTAGWCHYIEESGKGAFMEITEDLLKQYAPVTYETQDRASFEYGMIDGHLYYLPCNKVGYGHICVGIRGDLRKKYGIDEIDSIDDLYAYMSAVQADSANNGIQYAYAASLNGDNLQSMLMTGMNNLVTVATGFTYEYEAEPSADDIFWLYDSDEYKEYAKKMAEWAKEGFWSTNAVNNQTDTKDAFLAGTSAIYLSNLGTVGNVMNSVKQSNPEWDPEMYDLNMDKVCFGSFDNDGYAIPYDSKNYGRALMALDVLKNDSDAYYTIRYGMVGTQVILNDDGTWSQGENYGDGHWSYGAAPSWGLKNTTLERDQDTTFPMQTEIFSEWKEIAITNPTVAFAFSTEAVADAWANLNEVYTKYVPTLQLGLAEDVDAWIESFKKEAEAAGLEEVMTEIKSQLATYLENH